MGGNDRLLSLNSYIYYAKYIGIWDIAAEIFIDQ